MRMRAGSSLLALLLGLSLAAVGARPAYACSCASMPLKNEVRGSDAIFSGEVQSIDGDTISQGDEMAAPGRITFAVQDSWKGIAAESVEVYGQGDGVNCYNTFEEGEAYLVYASRAKGTPDAPLHNNACGETKPLAVAEADLRLLGPPVGSLPDTGGPTPAFVGTLLAIAVLSVSAFCAAGVLSKRMRS